MDMAHTPFVCAASLILASSLFAQGADGFRLYAPHGTSNTYLVDTNNNVVHTWPGVLPPGNGNYIEPDGTLLRSENIPGGPPIGGRGGGVTRVALDGTMIWDWEYADADGWAHHDVEPLPNGNVLVLVWDRMTQAEAIDAGRDPATLPSPNWLPDAIIEVEQTGLTTGNIVWEWHIMDHLIQDFDATKANFGVVADHPELVDINFPGDTLNNGEWNHCNALSYCPTRDIILLNSPFQDEFWIIDHSTTTAEAAGHTGGNFGKGGDILYRWGNPQSYDRGTAGDQKLFFQHGSNFIPPGRPGAGNVVVFNNRAGTPLGQNFSSVVEIAIPADFTLAPGAAWGPTDYVMEYSDPGNFYSQNLSNAERLENGNTLVCSGREGPRFFEILPDGVTIVAETTPPNVPAAPGFVFQVSHISRSLWSDATEISVSAGGTANFDLIAGSEHAGDQYLVLGSAAGTTPGTVLDGMLLPLNVDGYFLTMLSFPNVFPFVNTTGFLDANGRATASFTLPAGILPPEAAAFDFHHAYVVLDAATQDVVHTSNAVPLDWVN